ncbi:hypothetical protein CLV90_2037 [Maribacter spongiicola]|uniref:Uncharacterized protein n=1 Tax=Maribacter spongiicola TaxID=1206753 RepID=A0A4V3ER83_9FLAO|nr:hypothetical protein [Maribacter spongiicola]TDT44958.1 hypothetical protein CLV90_2037 [Maribacter spongiicola]
MNTNGWLGVVLAVTGLAFVILKKNYEFKNRTDSGVVQYTSSFVAFLWYLLGMLGGFMFIAGLVMAIFNFGLSGSRLRYW